ncbi:hypothetical protein BGZ46_001617, partial [Entomortierella lignicola]
MDIEICFQMTLKRLFLLLACVLALCSGLVLPNKTASSGLVLPNNTASSGLVLPNSTASVIDLEKRGLVSVCGSAIASYAPEVARYLWNTAQSYSKDLANKCLNNLFMTPSMCSIAPPRMGGASAGTVAGATCWCAYSVGSKINIENFLTLSTNYMARDVNSFINEQPTFFGAANEDVFCGDKERHMAISVSCLGDTAKDRVKACSQGTSSPLANF